MTSSSPLPCRLLPVPQSPVKWRHSRWTDELSGKQFETAYLTATSRTGYGDETPILWLRCIVGTPTKETYIAWDEFIDNEPALVAYRVSGGDLVQVKWSNSTSNNSTFLPSNRRAAFWQALAAPAPAAIHRLVARVWHYDDQTITAGWDLPGAQLAIQRLTGRCAA